MLWRPLPSAVAVPLRQRHPQSSAGSLRLLSATRYLRPATCCLL